MRPVIEVPGRILTRINPHKVETTMIMHIRPGWEDLRNFIRGSPAENGGYASSTSTCFMQRYSAERDSHESYGKSTVLVLHFASMGSMHSRGSCLKGIGIEPQVEVLGRNAAPCYSMQQHRAVLSCGSVMCRWRPRFNVYVCTAADREYALEVWRLLDPEAELIPFSLRMTHFKAGMQRKDINTVLSLRADPAHLNALRTAMPLAVVLDDRLDVSLFSLQPANEYDTPHKEPLKICILFSLLLNASHKSSDIDDSLPWACPMHPIKGSVAMATMGFVLQVWGDHSQPQILQVEAFSPNAQAAAAKSATVHDPSHYNKAAEELKAVADCLKGIHRGLYYEINVKLKAELAAARPSSLADFEQGRLPETRTCPCVRNHYVRPSTHQPRPAGKRCRFCRTLVGLQTASEHAQRDSARLLRHQCKTSAKMLLCEAELGMAQVASCDCRLGGSSGGRI